jgi:hypothetical protein
LLSLAAFLAVGLAYDSSDAETTTSVNPPEAARYTSTVYLIDHRTGDVIWRLRGKTIFV